MGGEVDHQSEYTVPVVSLEFFVICHYHIKYCVFLEINLKVNEINS